MIHNEQLNLLLRCFNYTYMERMVLLNYLKIYLDIDLEIILLDSQNNYVEHLSVDDTVAKV